MIVWADMIIALQELLEEVWARALPGREAAERNGELRVVLSEPAGLPSGDATKMDTEVTCVAVGDLERLSTSSHGAPQVAFPFFGSAVAVT
jgi:hypothetical protein